MPLNIQTSRDAGASEFRLLDPPNLPEHLVQMRDQVRRFVENEVVPVAEHWEREGKIPREIYRKMGALGLLGMRYPVEYGGTDLGPLASMVFAEELGRSTYGGFTSSVLVQTDMSASHIALRGTPEQKSRYLPGHCCGRNHLFDCRHRSACGIGRCRSENAGAARWR